MKIKKLTQNSKILNLTHDDLDGITCSIILGNVFKSKNIDYHYCSYYNIDSILKNINYDNYDFIFMTDITPNVKSLDGLPDKIILIDHHDSAINLNDPKNYKFINTKYCASKLVKFFCEKYFDINLSYLNKLVYYTNDYDMWIHESKNSMQLNYLVYYYWQEKFRKRFFDGNMKLTNDEKQYLLDRNKEYKKKYKELNVYNFERGNSCFISSKDFINEFCHDLMNEKGYDFVFCRNEKNNSISIRTIREDFHIGNCLKDLGLGGGHKMAAGFVCKLDNLYDNIEIILDKIENK